MLGRGGMAVVLDVEHVEDGTRRALKLTLPRSGGEEEVQRRFVREYRALSGLRHPGILEVDSWGSLDGRPYFVMERLDGRPLREEVELWRGLPPAERFRRAESVLVQLARALQYIHGRGQVHRDVTPANIMMLPDGRVKLMDFGVVKLPGAELTRVGEVVGTVAYIPPEQIQGGQVDARADLYSLGAVLYLMLTGRRPFNARSLAGYLDKHLNRPPRPPRELAPTLPQVLDDVCLRLLAKDPAERFSSATHLLYVLDPGEGVDAPSPLVGREPELLRIREALARTADGRAGVLWLEGAPGMGRARLVERVVEMARDAELHVSRSRATGPDQPPYQSFRSLYEDLTREHTAPLALQSTFSRQGPAPERLAVLGAFKELLVATQEQPRAVVLEALHRADRGSIELFDYLARNLPERAGLLLVGVRESPVGHDPLERVVTHMGGLPTVRVELGPLSASATEEMLLSLVQRHPLAGALAERLQVAGEGNPALLREMLRELVRLGVLIPGDGEVRGLLNLTRPELGSLRLPVPGNIRDRIRGRLEGVGADARRVASALAVARVEVGPGLLEEVLDLDEERLFLAVDELIEAGLVRAREVAEDERYELARHRLQDVLLEDLGADERRFLHRRIGGWLERQHRRATAQVVESLALHFEQGEVPGKALRYLVEAARELVDRAFIPEALALLERAEAVAPEAREHLTLDEADRWMATLNLARAQALVHQGQWDGAARAAEEADRLAGELGDPALQSLTATECGIQARRVRSLEAAEGHLFRALGFAREAADQRLEVLPAYEIGAVHWARGDLDKAREFFLQALLMAQAAHDERSLAVAYNGLGILAFCQGQSAEARRNFDKAVAISEEQGLLERLLICRTNLVELHHVTGNLRKGLELADQTVAHAREMAHPFGMAVGLRYRVLLLTDLRRLAEAEENALEAIRIQRGLNNPEEELATRVLLVRVHLASGDYEAARRELTALEPLIADYDSEGFAPVVLAWRARLFAEAGELEAAREALDAATSAPIRQWPHQLARLDLNVARAQALLGEVEAACLRAEGALEVADQSGFRYYAMRAHQLLARLVQDESASRRHTQVARSLARSLAANLPREDATSFLERHGLTPRGAPPRS